MSHFLAVRSTFSISSKSLRAGISIPEMILRMALMVRASSGRAITCACGPCSSGANPVRWGRVCVLRKRVEATLRTNVCVQNLMLSEDKSTISPSPEEKSTWKLSSVTKVWPKGVTVLAPYGQKPANVPHPTCQC